ncbi:hypothetical protein VTJ49DRAFT_6869 [Mycothermus thermophilus]|uniref:Uncharacterized protein n=1 Tax=Humicola insolens TaxID=85995 RepID=A0ABR3VQX2_HUMIN
MFQRSFRRLMAAVPATGTRQSNGPPPLAKLKLPPTITMPAPTNTNTNVQIHPSRRVQNFLAKHSIALPGVERLLAGQNYQKFPLRVLVAPHHILNFYDLRYLDQREDPLTDKILDFYETKKRENPHLWTYVQGKASAEEHKVVVRHASERRARAALFRALDAAGYDKFGKSKDGSKVSLRGTFRILILKPKEALQVEFDELVEYFGKLLGNATRQLTLPQPRHRTSQGSRGQPSPESRGSQQPGEQRPPQPKPPNARRSENNPTQ